MKVLNDLYDYGLKIYQDDENFKFSLDTILLAEVVKLKKNDKVLDLCTGGAPVPLILSTKYNNNIIGIEIQEYVYNLAYESIKYNNLENQIQLIKDNLLNIKDYFIKNSFDVITCNPPYFKYNKNSLINDIQSKAISRHEVTVTLKEIIETANYMLKEHGTFYLVHRIERLHEIMSELSIFNIIVKELYLIKTNNSNEIDLFIIKTVKGAKHGMKVKIIENNRKVSYKNIFIE